ncbi:MAG: bifunctional glutamate N-acetyltransferase/amino-acid acetyltransferase ArgJ [Nitrospirae bacterium]|nr:bifunctional glutamate N-acetyltransferase/amino-acid acetyltransferase ArgJ [Nitrospirota bacterium]MBF0540111.1 bifunctional glutamate N-acetyltransferase/amino-acid acetyltransferase ArgJ [Nitrospirota bacterium]
MTNNYSIPKEFLFAVIDAAIKYDNRNDIAIIYSKNPCVAAGVFTKNVVKSPSVVYDMERIKYPIAYGIVVNSGNANTCTGQQGMDDVITMSETVKTGLKISDGEVFVSSTGVIGVPMPMERIIPAIKRGIDKIGEYTLMDAAKAIMTTDTFPKIHSKTFIIEGKTVTISGITKGSGMISPNMATTLSFIITDAEIEKSALDNALRQSIEQSFNKITVDGDMSTNDTVLILANGACGNTVIKSDTLEYDVFKQALDEITMSLSQMIVKDGEGATKTICIELNGAATKSDAERLARKVADSMLVRTAVYGNDPNWGRIMCALGGAGVAFSPYKVDIFIGKVQIVADGLGTKMDAEASKALDVKDVNLRIDLREGVYNAKVFTCDLTEGYIKINAHYTT